MRGVTLIELMVTISILAILLAIAAPSFQQMLTSSRVTSLTNELVAALNFARSEAVKRGKTVTVCKSANPEAATPTCSALASWQTGWLIFVDEGTLGTVDGTDSRLKVGQPSGGNATITGSTSFANYVSYESTGVVTGGGTNTLDICLNGVQSRVEVNVTGRIRTIKGSC